MALTAAERQAARRRRQQDRIAALESGNAALESGNARLGRLLEAATADLAVASAETERLSSGGPALCRTCRSELACPRCYRSGDDF